MTKLQLAAMLALVAASSSSGLSIRGQQQMLQRIEENLSLGGSSNDTQELWYTTRGSVDSGYAGLYSCEYNPISKSCEDPEVVINFWGNNNNGYTGLGLSRLTKDTTDGQVYMQWDMGNGFFDGVSVITVKETDTTTTGYEPQGVVLAASVCPDSWSNVCGNTTYDFVAIAPFIFQYGMASHRGDIYVTVSYVKRMVSDGLGKAQSTAHVGVYKLNKNETYVNEDGDTVTCVVADPNDVSVRNTAYQFWKCFDLVTTFLEYPTTKSDSSGNPIYTKSNGKQLVFQAATGLVVEERNNELFFYTQVYRANYASGQSTNTMAVLLVATAKTTGMQQSKKKSPFGNTVQNLGAFPINTAISPMGTDYDASLEIDLVDGTMCLSYFSSITCGSVVHGNKNKVTFAPQATREIYSPGQSVNLGVTSGVALLSESGDNTFSVAFGTDPQPGAFQEPSGGYSVGVGSTNEHDTPLPLVGDENGQVPITNVLVM